MAARCRWKEDEGKGLQKSDRRSTELDGDGLTKAPTTPVREGAAERVDNI